jgi:hypothetical protein
VIIGAGIGYLSASLQKQKQIDQLQRFLIQEHTDYMFRIADAYHRGDVDDILLLIEAPISLEATMHQRLKNRVRDEYFVRTGMMNRIEAYLVKHPESRLKEGLTSEQEN